jgi:chromosomal replication initiation ATPase DnaA
MSRKSRREIEQAIEQLDTEEDDMDIEIDTEVTTVTSEDIGEEREPDVPDGATILSDTAATVSWIMFDEDAE